MNTLTPRIIVLIFTLIALLLAGCAGKEAATNATSGAASEEVPAEAVTAAAVQEATPEEVKEVEEAAPLVPAVEGITHTVTLIDGGFDVKDITIEAGDTVVWVNEREKKPTKALVIGTKTCAKLKSPMFDPGSVFSWKFEQKGVCDIVDGIYTTQLMKVIVTG